MELRIKYFNDTYEGNEIKPSDQSRNWIDLRCADTTHLKAGDFKLIPLGVAIKLPFGYEALLAPRSSTFKNWGVLQTNSVGVIDETYCGDNDQWLFPVYATRDTTINKGDRIAQFRIIQHQPTFKVVKVDHLSDTDRNGFGSTGIS